MCVLRVHVLAAVSVPIGAHMLALALKHDHLYGTLQRTYGMLIIAFTLIQVSSSLAHSTFPPPPASFPRSLPLGIAILRLPCIFLLPAPFRSTCKRAKMLAGMYK
jgi:hypothetical protein